MERRSEQREVGLAWLSRILAVSLLVFGAGQGLGQGAQDAGGALGNGSGEGQAQTGASPDGSQVDPPSRVVRIGVLQGAVSAEPAAGNTFAPAEVNGVLTTGDRMYTAQGAAAELQAEQIAVRLGAATDLTVTAMTDQLAQFGLAAGSVHLRSYAVPAGTVLELDSPEAATTVLEPGDVRVDEDAVGHATSVFVLSGQVQVDGPGISRILNGGEGVRIHVGSPETEQPAFAEVLAGTPQDDLDSFSGSRDDSYANGVQGSGDFLNPDTTGEADLAAYGSWDAGSEFGPVWFPVVSAGWRPYTDGHWRWMSPWGWTWVGSEPWAFAPFHYGRWAWVNGRWGWLPGPPRLHPVYAPALVAFVGGRENSGSVGRGPGNALTAWFPLGPREPYAPWYRGSTLYTNRLNASNIYDSNLAEARAFYNQRAVNVFVPGSLAGRSYANRAAGTVAVPEASFAGGQPVAGNQLHLSTSELAEAPLLVGPVGRPERGPGSLAAEGAVPPRAGRSALAGRDAYGGTPGRAVPPALSERPAFVHAQLPSAARPNPEEPRPGVQRTAPGRVYTPQPAEGARQSRPVQAPASRESALRPAGPAPPARAAPAAAAPHK